MSELENIENYEDLEVIPSDNTTEEVQENVEQSTGEVSGEVSGEVIEEPEDNLAEIEAEQERLRLEHEEFLNSFPGTTVFYRDLLINGNIKKLGMATKDPHVADYYKILDNHFDESELTYIGTPECGTYYLKGYEKPEPTEEEKMLAHKAKIEADIHNYLQELVASRGYDTLESCLSYYNSTVEKWKYESRAITKHRDQLYRKGYDLIEQCKRGEIDYRIVDLQYILNLIDPLDW